MHFSDLIGYLVVALVIFGPWLLKLFNKAGEADKKNKAQLQESSHESRPQASRPSLHGQARATNMTMAERIAQARAKAASAAKSGRQAAQPLRQTQAQTQEAAHQLAVVDRRRVQVKAQQQQQRQLQRQQIALRKAQRAALADAQRVRQHQQDKALQAQRQQAAEARRQSVSSAARTKVPEPIPVAAVATSWRLNRRTLRRAIVLKEILDKPVALRSAQGF